MPLEFRVRFQRGDRQSKTIIYQDWNAACRKVQSIKAMDEIKGDTERFEDMPDLVSIELQVREVGEWRRHDYQPEATDPAGSKSREAWNAQLQDALGSLAPDEEHHGG